MTDTNLLTDVELVELETLLPYANNPKDHPDEQVDKIAASIRNYGFDQPIVIDGDGEIIKGHGRYAAARRLDLESVPVIWRDGLSPAEVKAARIADNKTQMESGWDIGTLSVEFESLEEMGLDVSQTGFSSEEVESIIDHQDLDVDEFFEAAEDDEFEDDSMDDEDEVPPGEFACPECGHTFEPTIDDMGEG